jgi:archaellum component FlaC
VDETLKLPVEADTAAFVANLARAAEALEKLALANQQSANKTEKNDKALEGLGEKLDALKSRTKDGIEVISQWAERINAAIEKVAELSDEGDRLARTQENLGVSLEQAQSNAVGFADETEIATAALTLQERGIRVTQQELNALTRIASSYARTTGKELGEVMENLAETVTEGGEELGKFDLALLDVADGTHTAQERLDAMVRRAREIPDAADSATDSFRRLKDEVHDLGVEAANTFVHEFERVNEIPGELYRVRGYLESDGRDALINMRFANGDTPLLAASISMRYPLVEYLLSCGADPNISDSRTIAVLHGAVASHSLLAMRVFLAYGARTEMRVDSELGLTALHGAVAFHDPESRRTLAWLHLTLPLQSQPSWF